MTAIVNKSTKKRVFAGLSGGVDSAVAASLLKEAGHEVVGVFIKGWYPPELPCTWAEDRRDAMRVAAHLRIPFQTLDASAEYKASVIDYLVAEYAAGRTPNPDIFCNRDVKFGAFYRFAKGRGADAIATGHYARTGEGRLYRGADAVKDQSYFLWAIPDDALSHTLFPLGGMAKEKTRALARARSLPVATKPDSQGICFLGPVSMDDFLKSELETEPGIARDETGQEIGRHDGAVLHTLGARVALADAPSGPWYVRGKDMKANELIVSRDRARQETREMILLERTNFFRAPEAGERYQCQYRYHGPLVSCTYDAEKQIALPQEPLPELLAPGQSLVIYEGDEALGGGIIG